MKTGRKVRQRIGKMDWRKVSAAVVATILVVALVIGLLPNKTVQVLAADRMSDLSTATKYTESLGDNASTEYAGRVWTDKTVYTEDAVLTGYSGSSQTVEKGEDDFLVSFSALATSQSISGEEQAPIDVVFIIDISGSMSNQNSAMTNSAGQTYSRIKFTIDAVNDAIDAIMDLNPYTRVGVVGFSNSAVTLLPLDRYTKTTDRFGQETEYFTLSRNTASSNYADIYTNAVNSAGRTITSTNDVEGGTNTQKGIYQGMNLLATAGSTKATINGEEVQRVPAVILLSDGASTYSQTDSSWWAPTGNDRQGPGSSAYYGNGMLAMMTGAYMKAEVDRHYGVTGTAYDTTIYTVGMGINDLDNSQRNLARVTLNPSEHFDDTTNSYAVNIKNAWDAYCGTSGNDTTPDIVVDEESEWQSSWPFGGEWVTVPVLHTLAHPTSNDISGDAIKNYVDNHYDADDADSVTTVFKDIVSDIAISTPMVPTEHDVSSPTTSGYITYTDPIGEYMEVKDMKAIIYAGQRYEAHSKTTSGNVTKYTFTETAVGNAVYGSEELSHIIIEVESATDSNGIKEQVLTVKIPASLIPIRVNTVHLSGSETTGYTVKSHTNNGTYPIRLFYTVGLQEAVMDGNIVATHKLATEYVKANSNADGTINFYSNLYTGQVSPYYGDHTIGDATVTFDADVKNPFYYVQEDILIYEDKNFTQVADGASLDDNATYYYKEVHYHGTSIETEAVARLGVDLKNNTEVRRYPNGQWYRPAGTVRVNRMLTFEGRKIANATNTADDFYTPTFDETTGHFVVYLGNNGVMSAIAGGSLAISKTVTADEGLAIQSDREFTFTVSLKDGNNPIEGEYVYAVTNAAGEEVSTGTIADGGTLKLKDGQKATILSLPPNTEYKVTETPVDGFTPSATGDEGTIQTGVTSEAQFTNRYTISTPVTFPTTGALTGTKVLTGRAWDEDVDNYTFLITPYNNAPLPEGYDAAKGVTVTKATKNGEVWESVFDFGVIEYTKPGTYRYTIVEKEPENDKYIEGISYSRALYRVVVEVVDNKNGTLTATSDIQKLYTDGAEPLFTYDTDNKIVMNSGQEGQDAIVFTNTYSASAIVRVPVATKDYTDNSGNKPLVSGMFEFELEPLGYLDAQGNLVAGTASYNPMPLNPDDNNNKFKSVTTTNEGANITFPGVAFGVTDIISGSSTTYRYKMTEVLPTGAAENNNIVNGMKYDSKEVIIDVTVSIDNSVLNVNAVYPGGERITTFENEYTPSPAVATVEGTKTLTGRDMKSGETYNFAITPSNAAMNLAVRDGIIVMPTDETASVTGGTDGNAVAFAFDEITFTKPGVYTFNVSETVPDSKAGGVIYDEHICLVTVTVTDENGQLKAAVTYDNGTDATDNTKAIFTNTYAATFDENTAISLSGTKNMTGRAIEEGEFFFEVTLGNGARATYVTAATNGKIQFLDKMTYTEAGEYVYYISEVIPNPKRGGMTYDRAIYRVTVNVTDDFEGTLSAAIIDIEKSTDGTTYNSIGTNGAITFENIYKADSETVDLLGISKVISGTRGEALKAGEFTFKLTLVSGDADGVVLPSATTTTNRADGTVVFGDGKLTFSKVGTYVIQVEEVVPSDATKNADGTYTKNGITYSTNVIRSTFVVTDNLEGELIVTRTGTVGSREFVNTYNTTGTLKGSTELIVVKNFTGRDGNAWLDTDSFSFVLEAHDEATQKAIEDGKVVMPTNAGGIIIDADDADKKAAFGDIVFYEAGTYTFAIREEAGTIPGIEYDATSRTIKVVTTDQSDGSLLVTANGNSESELTFDNVYKTGEVILYGHGTLHVTKEFTGRENNEWLDTDSFKFTLAIDESDNVTKTAYNAGKIEMASTELVINHDNKDYAHFGNITFKQVGTYKFIVDEVEGTISGVDYDTSTKTVIVNVTDNGDGTLNAVVNASSDALTFSNTYTPDTVELIGQTNLKITKVIEGRKWETSDEFKFLLEAGDAFTTENAVISEHELTVKNQGNKMTATDDYTVETYFGNVTLKKAGVYRFRILEKNAENTANMAYDRHSTVVIVTVTDNYSAGQLEVTDVRYIGNMVWTNVHTPDAINVTLTGVKQLVGRTLTASDKFNFTIEVAEGSPADTPLPYVISLQNMMSEISFGPLTFTEDGTYKYIIRESGMIAGVTNDSGYVIATVEVIHDTVDGHFEYEISYQKMDAAGTQIGTEFKFVNTYSSSGTLEGKTNLKVTKNFTGRANDAWLDSDKFEFTLAVDSAHTPTVNAVANNEVVLPTEKTLTIDKDNKDDAYFGDITFTKEGTYQFVVTETEGSIAGVDYDKTTKTVIVNVIDKGDGTMAVALTSGSNALTFTNTYEAKSISRVLEGLKKISGRPFMNSDIFGFTLNAVDNAPLPAVVTAENDADGKIAFAPITFTKAGVYVYEITETSGSAAGVTDVTGKVTATVTVEDKNVGQLEISSVVYSIPEGNGFAYTNKYATTETDGVTIDGIKVVSPSEGNGYTIVGGEFDFEITPAPNNPGNDPIVQQRVKNKADGTITFADGAIYTQAGDYVYTVRELSGTAGCFGYDDTVYTVTVKVVDEPANAKLKATVVITKENSPVNDITFDNSYTPGVATTVLYGKKVLDSEHIDLTADKFQFKLEAIGTDAAKTPMPESGKELARNDATGKFQFGTITYKAVGEYTYQISEVNSGDKGYTYDDTKYTITVKVTDNGGVLNAEVTGLEKQDGTEAVVFTNGYTPEAVTLEGDTALVGKKKLNGRGLKANEFKFQLIDKDNKVVAEAQNDADGNFKLEPVTFTKVGTYYYTIVEVDTELGGVTYDETVYTVKVNVTDAGGYLKADVTYLNGNAEAEVVFENNYQALPVGLQISAAKTLKGRELKAGEFTFLLKNAAGEVVAKATNNVDGLIVFEEIKYDKVGTYEYTISEEKGNAEHVTYDDSVYKVTITVTDDLVGAMKADVDYHGVNPAFNNSYKEPQSVIPTGDFAAVLPMMMMALAAGVIVVTMKKKREAR